MAVSEAEAIEIARTRIIADGKMPLTSRISDVEDGGAAWHVSFPSSLANPRGGEPHVIVNKSDGAIVRVYYTQ